MKKTFYTELAYLLGIFGLAAGTALTERADFGMSMIVAPSYLIHLQVSKWLPFFTFGVAEYMVQFGLILVVALFYRKFKRSYLFSFVTAILYSLMLDGSIWAMSLVPYQSMVWRCIYYVAGLVVCAAGVALIFRTYITPGGYDLFVMEMAKKYNIPVNRYKTMYDYVSCAVSVVLSFVFYGFGKFVGIRWGTIVYAAVNGWVITQIGKLLEHFFEFKDGLPLRKYFK